MSDKGPSRVVATLFPGYFALVMATGIIAIGAELHDLGWIAEILYVVAVAAFVVLSVLFVLRAVWYRQLVVADLTAHARGFAFLTVVAGANIVAAASAVIHDWWGVAWVLWWAGNVLWLFFVYTTAIAVLIARDKPPLGMGINGSWFLLTVSTQSVVVVAALLLTRSASDLLAFAAIAMYTLGILLYLIVMTMLFLRWTFHELDPTEADPPAWIAAGAVAITVLAGSNLLLTPRATRLDRIDRIAPFLEATVVMAWATATFWLPVMIAIGVWRHVVRRLPLRYQPSYWALVFPLGMYSVATYRMRAAVHLEALDWVTKSALGVALVAWAVTFVGMARQAVRSIRRRHV